jgi:enamine deaminase RidA (YjgF/YER057c/UK114 family)/acyl-CoA thioesterase FadM
MTRTPDEALATSLGLARVYRKDLLVRFAACAPAGIVFYPRYLEIFNNLVEDWCSEELKFSFSEIVARRGWGLSTVHLEVDFKAPSVFGETLSATLSLNSLGTTSIGLGHFVARTRTSCASARESGAGADRPSSRPRHRHSKGSAREYRRVPGRQMIRIKSNSRTKDRETMKFLQPAHWVRPKGYANGVSAQGRSIFVSGMIGCDAEGKLVSEHFAGQLRQTLNNIVEVLSEANAKPEHIVRMNWYVLDKDEYVSAFKEIGTIYRELIGNHYPSMTAVQVASLIEVGARLEIEVTAVVPE